MITQLRNPQTQVYERFKSEVLSDWFPWNYFKGDGASPEYYSHTILTRPGYNNILCPVKSSDWFSHANEVLTEIFHHNDISVKTVYRINCNAVHYTNGKASPIHRDHDFPTKNLLVYLTAAGGKTNVYAGDVMDSHDPKEDDIITFGGLHNMNQPEPGSRRVVLVCTYEPTG